MRSACCSATALQCESLSRKYRQVNTVKPPVCMQPWIYQYCKQKGRGVRQERDAESKTKANGDCRKGPEVASGIGKDPKTAGGTEYFGAAQRYRPGLRRQVARQRNDHAEDTGKGKDAERC